MSSVILTCIASIKANVGEISYYQSQIQELTALHNDFYSDLINFYQGLIPGAVSSAYFYLVIGILCAVIIAGCLTTVIKLDPAGIRRRIIFFTKESSWPDIVNIIPDTNSKQILISLSDHGDFKIYPEFFPDYQGVDPLPLIHAFWDAYCEPDTDESNFPVISDIRRIPSDQTQVLKTSQNFSDDGDQTLKSTEKTYNSLNQLLKRYGLGKVQFCPRCGSPDARDVNINEGGQDNPLLPLWRPLRCMRCGTTYSRRTGREIHTPWDKWWRVLLVIALIILIMIYFIFG